MHRYYIDVRTWFGSAHGWQLTLHSSTLHSINRSMTSGNLNAYKVKYVKKKNWLTLSILFPFKCIRRVSGYSNQQYVNLSNTRNLQHDTINPESSSENYLLFNSWVRLGFYIMKTLNWELISIAFWNCILLKKKKTE